jgi:hypothetical protein
MCFLTSATFIRSLRAMTKLSACVDWMKKCLINCPIHTGILLPCCCGWWCVCLHICLFIQHIGFEHLLYARQNPVEGSDNRVMNKTDKGPALIDLMWGDRLHTNKQTQDVFSVLSALWI